MEGASAIDFADVIEEKHALTLEPMNDALRRSTQCNSSVCLQLCMWMIEEVYLKFALQRYLLNTSHLELAAHTLHTSLREYFRF